MLGTLVNFSSIMLGGFVGLLIKGRLKERYKDTVMQGMALAVLIIGLSGAVGKLFAENANSLVLIISLAIGGLSGEFLDIDGKFRKFAEFLQKKLVKESGKSENRISQGFVTASVLYCVGTMAVVGSIESGIMSKHDILFAKSLLDGISAVVLGASLGAGVMLSAFSVLVYQGAITLAAGLASPYITESMLNDISVVGGILIFAIGTNMLNLTKIKLANFLPAVFVPVVCHIAAGLLN